VSADAVVPSAGKPQALNRYAYVFNNPLKYVDPSGHDPEDNKECRNIENCLPAEPSPDCARNPSCAYEFTEQQIAALRGRFHPKLRAAREGLEYYRKVLEPHKDSTNHGTFSIGYTVAGGAAGGGGSLTAELVFDNQLNFDIQVSPAGGSMLGAGASHGLVFKATNAPTVDDLVTTDKYGMAASTGVSASKDPLKNGKGLVVGMDYIHQAEGKIRGVELMIGQGYVAANPLVATPVEGHGFVGPTFSIWRSWLPVHR
jgi:hypothetical protein